MLYAEFGRLLRKCRQAAELTQDELAARVGLGRTSITNMEQGKQHVSLHVLYALGDALGVQPAELLPKRLLEADQALEQKLGDYALDDDKKRWIMERISAVQKGRTG